MRYRIVFAIALVSSVHTGHASEQIQNEDFLALQKKVLTLENSAIGNQVEIKRINSIDIATYTEFNIVSNKIDRLENIIDEKTDLIVEAEKSIDSKMSQFDNSFKNLYSAFHSLFILVLIAFVSSMAFVFKQMSKTNLIVNDSVQSLKGVQDSINEGDLKIVGLASDFYDKLNSTDSKSQSSDDDHSLALRVADEVNRMNENLGRMAEDIKGKKQLTASLKATSDNFLASGYEIVPMLGSPYQDGLAASATFIPKEDLARDEKIISRVVKPQVNYQGAVIQTAQIEVSVGE